MFDRTGLDIAQGIVLFSSLHNHKKPKNFKWSLQKFEKISIWDKVFPFLESVIDIIKETKEFIALVALCSFFVKQRNNIRFCVAPQYYH